MALREKLHDVAAAFGQFGGGPVSFHRSCLPWRFVLSTPEVATIWHPATILVRTTSLATVGSRQLEPPVTLAIEDREPGLAILGRVAFQHRSDAFGIRRIRGDGILPSSGRPGWESRRCLEICW